MNACELIYKIGAENKIYGTEKGICRITGEEGEGLIFNKWVRDTFNDHDKIYPGTIISNEALFCFDEASEIVQKRANKEKLQRFRTYSHLVFNGEWYCFTKANKREIFDLICKGAEMVCLAESGQKHILFKHKEGMWQLEEMHVMPDIELLKHLHFYMCELLSFGFSQTEIVSGNYISSRLMKVGLELWKQNENEIKDYRDSAFFEFVSFMLYTDEVKEQKQQVQIKSDKPVQQTLF